MNEGDNMETSIHDPWSDYFNNTSKQEVIKGATEGLTEPKDNVAKERYTKLINETDMSKVKVEKM